MIAVVVASLVRDRPTFLIQVERTDDRVGPPYTPLELAGRDIYPLAEGCYNCHSQMVRPMRSRDRSGTGSTPSRASSCTTTRSSGALDESAPTCTAWATSTHTTGTCSTWRPRGEVTPGSIMPPYPWLLTQDLDFDSIPGTVRAMEILGASYGDVNGRIPEAALDQARVIGAEIVEQGGPEGLETKKIVALIAYLQRMGTDIYKAAPEEAAVAEEISAASPASSTKAK